MIDETQIAVDMGREALYLVMMISLPLLGVGLVVGLFVSIMQSATSVQEQTLSFIPKILAVVITMLIILPWITTIMMDYTRRLFTGLPTMFGP